ncbi:MAG: hypothetical protein AAF192_11075 [Pseudomonadota bacterium]
MTILTGVVLTIALGAVAQRGDLFGDFGMATAYVPRDDIVTVAAGGSYLIDVTANDEGAQPGDGARMLITDVPSCGIAYRRDGALAYEAGAGCDGPQRLSYCVASGDQCREAEVTLVVVTESAALGSASGTPIRSLEPEAQVRAAAVGDGGPSGFRVEGGEAPAAGGTFTAISALPFGVLVPKTEAEIEAAADDVADDVAEGDATAVAAPAAAQVDLAPTE